MSAALGRGPDRDTIGLLGQRPYSRLQQLHARLADDSWTRRQAFQLRYLCYQSEGYIDPRLNEEFSDEYDFGCQSRTLVLYDSAAAIGSVRLCTARRSEGQVLPLASTFPAEFEDVTKACDLTLEINRLVCHPSQAKDQVVFTLLRIADSLIREIAPEFIGICVRSNHVGLWKRLRFHKIAGPRTYSGLKFPTYFLGMPSDRFALVRTIVPMLRIGETELAAYRRLLDSETVQVFGDE